MKKLLAVLIAGAFATSAFAAEASEPMTMSNHAEASATHKKAPAKKATHKKSHKKAAKKKKKMEASK